MTLTRKIAAGVAAVALLTGCIEEDSTAPADWAPALPASAPELGEDDAVFIFRLFTADLDTATSDNLTDAEVIEFGGLVCDMAAHADNLGDFLLMGLEVNEGTGLSSTDAGTVLGAAIGAFCPEQGDRLGFDS